MPACAALWFTILFLGGHGQALAAAYSWVDDQGSVHYGQTPPGGVVTRRIETPTDTGAADTELQERIDQMEERRAVEKAQAAQRTEHERQAQTRARNCSAARRNLDRLQGRGRIKARMGDGYRYLTDQEHDEAITRARTQIGTYCQPADRARP